MINEITVDELQKKLTTGEALTILDIRGVDVFNAGHIPGAKSFSRDLDPFQITTINPNQPVIVNCFHGNSSKGVTAALQEKGFDVYSLEGGYAAWEENFPNQVERTR